MSIRILWNMHEAAVLLQALIRVLSGKANRKKTIAETSSALRRMAEKKGFEVDEKFRNENGISLQMQCLEYAYTDRRSGLPVTSGWFFDIVQIYREEREEYRKLLREARIMIESASETRNSFQTWLENRKPNIAPDNIRKSVSALNFLLDGNRFVRAPLFEIYHVDDIETLIEKIDKNLIPKIYNAKRHAFAINGLKAYRQFLESMEVDDSEDGNTPENEAAQPSNQELDGSSLPTEMRIGAATSEETGHRRLEDNDLFTQCARTPSASEGATGIECERIKATLNLNFEFGFKNDGVERCRFRDYYKTTNGVDCPLDDWQLVAEIEKIGFEFNGKFYIISEDEKANIRNRIEKYESQGVGIVYYDPLYELDSEEYFNSRIVSWEMLRDLLKVLMPRFRYKSNYFALPCAGKTEVELVKNDILRIWDSGILRTYDELSSELPTIPIEKIKLALSQNNEFIKDSNGKYTRADLIETDKDEIEKLAAIVEKQCEKFGKVSLDELPFDNFKLMNPGISDNALDNYFCGLMKDGFERNGRILVRKGKTSDVATVIAGFCLNKEKCRWEELLEVVENSIGPVRQSEIVEAANSAMVRVDKNLFVADRLVDFDVDKIDAALEQTVNGDFMGMREIATFSLFPSCGFKWNLFLLESYCRRFSKKYKYDTRGANSSNSGAVVAKTCAFNYHTTMAYAAARSGIALKESEVFDFLLDAGYIERKRYSNIASLIKDAKRIRERGK